VPFACGWLAWERRDALRRCPRMPTLTGLGLLIAAVAMHLIAWRLRLGFVSGFAMVAVVVALVRINLGSEALRVLRVPLAFLVFMVPVPGILLIGASFKMKLWAATLATRIISWIGISAVQEGSTIRVPGVNVIVDDTCSGLRSLITLLAISALWAVSLPKSARIWQRLVLVAASMPIALLTNMARVLILLLLAAVYGAKSAEGFIHFGSGIVVFGLALLLLAALSRLIIPPSQARPS
jgi:exosortase